MTNEKERIRELIPSAHRLVLKFLNEAVRVEDLVYGKPQSIHSHPIERPEHYVDKKQKKMDFEVAKDVIDFRDINFPLGFRHLNDLLKVDRFSYKVLDHLIATFSASVLGEWNDFPVDIPRRGNGSRDGVVHAAVLKTGEVLFITADETTLLWDPEDTTASTFDNPVNQPHTMPLGYSQLCGHHVQLSDEAGSLLSVGGGGYGPNSLAKAGYIFDPNTKSWSRTANDMSESKWYPTAVSLGGKKVLITCGNRSGHMEIFDEVSKTFESVEGDTHGFPNLYPGLHLLPNNAIFYSRTGWGDAGAGSGGIAYDDPSESPLRLGGKRPAYFTFSGDTAGDWQTITPASVNRAKGMSILLLSTSAPFVRILVMGGTDDATNHTYEILDASILSPTASFDASIFFPDGEHRSLCSGVLLPDGNLFVCGGIQRTNSPCTMFDTNSNTWSPMANLPSIRDYHSVAVLLPSGKVMMAGWNNPKIEIFTPPYLLRGTQPTISNAPDIIHHGAQFTIESPDAASIVKVVLVRPMAVTHQTDSEQKVIELPYIHDHANPSRLTLTAPNGAHPHPIAQRGHYMLFAVNIDGIPSIASWIYLH